MVFDLPKVWAFRKEELLHRALQSFSLLTVSRSSLPPRSLSPPPLPSRPRRVSSVVVRRFDEALSLFPYWSSQLLIQRLLFFSRGSAGQSQTSFTPPPFLIELTLYYTFLHLQGRLNVFDLHLSPVQINTDRNQRVVERPPSKLGACS